MNVHTWQATPDSNSPGCNGTDTTNRTYFSHESYPSHQSHFRPEAYPTPHHGLLLSIISASRANIPNCVAATNRMIVRSFRSR